MNFLYECGVFHQRLEPVQHGFDYRVFMFSVDLEDIPSLGRTLAGFSHNRFNLFSIDDKDHVDMGLPGGIRPNLEAWLAGEGVKLPAGFQVRMITFPRVLGYGFNPVTFYYLTDGGGDPLLAVAEVTNTYREMKLYLVDEAVAQGAWHKRVAKDFYVSPFSDPGDAFDFMLGPPLAEWKVDIDHYSNGVKTLASSVHGTARPLVSSRLVWYSLKYPLLSFKIIAGIHWQAFRLWLRGTPYFRKADRQEVQREVMRPHSSLNRHES